MPLLQASMPDLSWLAAMGELALLILVFGYIAHQFIKFGLPKVLEHRKELELAKINASKGVLSENIPARLEKIEESIDTLVNERATNEKAIKEKYDIFTMLVYSIIIYIPGLDVETKFEILIKYFKNGGNGIVKEEAILLILAHKTEWQRVLNRDHDKQKDNKEYQDILHEIKVRVHY